MSLNDIYSGTTRYIRVNISLDDQIPDISSGSMDMIVKLHKGDSDSNAVLSSSADILTSGSMGTAIFALSPIDTNINPGNYYYEILWTRSNGDKYVVDQSTVKIKDRVYTI